MNHEDLLKTVQANHKERRQDIQAHYRRGQRRMIAAMVLLFLVMVGLDYLDSRLPSPPSPSVVTIANLRPLGATDLCPGETLRYTYQIIGDLSGVLDIDMTIWRVTPPQTVLYSLSRRDVLVRPVDLTRTDAWVVPDEGTNPLTLQPLEWQPGDYERRVAISTPSRNTEPAIAVLPFRIRQDCR
jgi:hypothetical protein